MNRHPVSSSRMTSVGWENNVMEIQFTNGAVYQYFNVSEQDYKNFINSPSLGSALCKFEKIHRYAPVR